MAGWPGRANGCAACLTRRGVAIPSGLVIAGAVREAPAAIPVTLTQGAIRIALELGGEGNAAAILARKVLHSMLLGRVRVATVLLSLAIVGGYWAWYAVAAGDDQEGQTDARSAVARAPAPSQPRTDFYGDPLPRGAAMRLGTVRFRQTPFISNLVYSPDGRFIVTDNRHSPLQVWDARDGKKLRQLDVGIEEIRDLAISPDGNTIAVVGYHSEPERNRMVQLLTLTDITTGRRVAQGEWDERYEVGLAYAPDGKTIATLSENGSFRLWDVATMKVLHEEHLGTRNSGSIAFSPNVADHLLAIAAERTIVLWDAANRREVRVIPVDGNRPVTDLAFSPDGASLAAGISAAVSEIRLWRVNDGSLLKRFKSEKETEVVNAGIEVSFSPDGKVLAGTGHERRLVLFDVAIGKELNLLSTARLAHGPLSFSPDGSTLATTGDQQTLHFWELATGKDRLATPGSHEGGVGALAILAGGKTLVSGSDDRTVRIWDLTTGRPTKCFTLGGWVRSLSVSGDGSLLAAATTYPEQDGVRVWNVKTGQQLHVWPIAKPQLSFPRGVTLNADGSSVIAALGDGSLRRWDVSTGSERPIAQPKYEKVPLVGPGLDAVERAIFSRDGRLVAFIGRGWTQVLDVASGELRFKERSSTNACEFAPDGRSLAIVRRGPPTRIKLADGQTRVSSAAAPSTILWLDSQTGQMRREIVIPESNILSLAFSPDGKAIAAGTLLRPARGIIRIFRLQDKQEIATFEAPFYSIQSLCFTPDGKRIVAGLSDTSIVIWDVRARDERP